VPLPVWQQDRGGCEAAQTAAIYLSSQTSSKARAVVNAVDRPHHPRLVADRSARVEEDRPHVVLDQLPEGETPIDATQ